MIDRERTYLISRYLNGEMRSDERAGFQARMKNDPKLQKMLAAEELIRGTIRRDLDALPTGHTTTEAHVMASLASLSSTISPPGSSSMGTGSTSSGSFSPGNAFSWGSTVLKSVLGVTIGTGILVGSYALLQKSATIPPPIPPVPATERSITIPQAPLPPASPAVVAPIVPETSINELQSPAELKSTQPNPPATNRPQAMSHSQAQPRPESLETKTQSTNAQRSESISTDESTQSQSTEKLSQRKLPVIKKTEKIPVLIHDRPSKAIEP